MSSFSTRKSKRQKKRSGPAVDTAHDAARSSTSGTTKQCSCDENPHSTAMKLAFARKDRPVSAWVPNMMESENVSTSEVSTTTSVSNDAEVWHPPARQPSESFVGSNHAAALATDECREEDVSNSIVHPTIVNTIVNGSNMSPADALKVVPKQRVRVPTPSLFPDGSTKAQPNATATTPDRNKCIPLVPMPTACSR